MPPSVHKILMQGAEVINSSLLPVGQMSEDAQESTNKYIKKFQEYFSRKFSRVKIMEDMLHLLLKSDPFNSSCANYQKKKKNSMSLLPEDISLLVAPSIPVSKGSSSNFRVESTDCESNYSSDD